MTTSVVTKRRFSVKEYYMMADVGIFGEEDRVELVDGEIVEMAAIGSYHAGCVMCLNTLFTQKIGDRVFVNVQNPIQLDKLTVFQPDSWRFFSPEMISTWIRTLRPKMFC